MTTTATDRDRHRLPDRTAGEKSKRTRALLACGALAGPIFIAVAAAQIAVRDGFDLSRHALSLLSNGPGGWVQIANFMLTGLLVVAAARGARAALGPGRGATWGPLLLAGHGVGLFAAGVFSADPSDGFPVGTPLGMPDSISWHGVLHAVAFGAGMLSVVAACVVLARALAIRQLRGWALYSAVTGALVPILLAAPLPVGFGIRAATVQVVVSIWIAALSLRLRHAPLIPTS